MICFKIPAAIDVALALPAKAFIDGSAHIVEVLLLAGQSLR